MVVSLATWTSSNVNYRSSEHLDYVLALIGSLNSNLTEYFSHAKSYTNENDLRNDIGPFVRLAIDAYYQVIYELCRFVLLVFVCLKENQVYPTTILLGRNIFSPLDNLKIIQDYEIQSILNQITDGSRLIVFAYLKEMIYDWYNYVQVKKNN